MTSMPPPLKRTLTSIFLAGLLAALPLAATLLVIVWVLRLLFAYVGPGSFIGQRLVALGLGGGSSEVLGYLIGVAWCWRRSSRSVSWSRRACAAGWHAASTR
ncbi:MULTISPECIES: hypothetical protein [unclassified Methylibium]|uniref:hypothetical protein n=1 Tax=unclassified Methylibium TaxID=2633235 RepID=UPI0003F44D75|nr:MULTISPECIES: hypothetical protein [unclassified Methylibium]EWS56484.1 hypothetical protein X551_00723 [Methylibium sp. T29]EWS61605.1 hypothetical protein Y694_00664 [Methylibium sp. T29-B]